ncbi:MAG: hypothetical protein QGG01_05700, partial [Roseibacillus sp.]|nr:hypothetical protein [Roseibacillus sp.]
MVMKTVTPEEDFDSLPLNRIGLPFENRSEHPEPGNLAVGHIFAKGWRRRQGIPDLIEVQVELSERCQCGFDLSPLLRCTGTLYLIGSELFMHLTGILGDDLFAQLLGRSLPT